jgi:hypothetical protein
MNEICLFMDETNHNYTTVSRWMECVDTNKIIHSYEIFNTSDLNEIGFQE